MIRYAGCQSCFAHLVSLGYAFMNPKVVMNRPIGFFCTYPLLFYLVHLAFVLWSFTHGMIDGGN